MILFKNEKIAFALPPKTGTTTAKVFLFNSKKCVELMDRHTLPTSVFEFYPDIAAYKIYCFLRNPITKFLSAVAWVKGISKDPDITTRSYEYLINKHELVFRPQSVYFKKLNVTALDFDNYEIELRRATEGLGLEDFPIVHANKAPVEHDPVNDELVSLVRQRYVEDYALAKDRLGKEY